MSRWRSLADYAVPANPPYVSPWSSVVAGPGHEKPFPRGDT